MTSKKPFGFTEPVSKTIQPVKQMKKIGTKMTPEIPFENKLKAEINLTLDWFQIVRNDSSSAQGFTIDMQETSQLLPNKLPKPLNQYSNWKIKSSNLSAENISKYRLKAEFHVRFNQFQSLRDKSNSSAITKYLPGNFILSRENVSKTFKTVKQLKNRKYKKVGGNFFNNSTKSGR